MGRGGGSTSTSTSTGTGSSLTNAIPAAPSSPCYQVHAALKDWPLSEQYFLQAAKHQQVGAAASGLRVGRSSSAAMQGRKPAVSGQTAVIHLACPKVCWHPLCSPASPLPPLGCLRSWTPSRGLAPGLVRRWRCTCRGRTTQRLMLSRRRQMRRGQVGATRLGSAGSAHGWTGGDAGQCTRQLLCLVCRWRGQARAILSNLPRALSPFSLETPCSPCFFPVLSCSASPPFQMQTTCGCAAGCPRPRCTASSGSTTPQCACCARRHGQSPRWKRHISSRCWQRWRGDRRWMSRQRSSSSSNQQQRRKRQRQSRRWRRSGKARSDVSRLSLVAPPPPPTPPPPHPTPPTHTHPPTHTPHTHNYQ